MIRTDNYKFIKKLSGLDIHSFETLFREYYQVLCAYAFRFLNDPDSAEEIVQDLFYTLWEKKDELQINTSVKSYLYSAVHNRCIKHIEHRKVETRYQQYYLKNESEIGTEPEGDHQALELQEIINDTLKALPERCSKIFRLNRFEGLKYHEIAARMAISVKTVEANMGKALKALRKSLKDYVEIA